MVGVRKTVLLLALISLGVLLASGIALAATFTGNDGDNVISGGSSDDTIDGKGGADALYGKGGKDTLYGAPGNDHPEPKLHDKDTNPYLSAGMRGCAGNDTIDGQEGDDDMEGNG